MLRRRPTRIEVKQDDMEELELAAKAQASQQGGGKL